MPAPSLRTCSFALLLLVGACSQSTLSTTTAPAALAGEWSLVELDGLPAPTGAGGRRATLRFDVDSTRVAGFAGCNRVAANFTIARDSLRFGPAVMTKMACNEGMELEGRVAGVLSNAKRYQLAANELTLFGSSGSLARFTRVTP